MAGFPYYSHLFRDSYGSDMGIVWETYHKGVPILGVPGITLDSSTDAVCFWKVLDSNREESKGGFCWGETTGVGSGMLGHIMYWKQTPSFKNGQVCVPTASLNSPVKWCDTCILLGMFILCQAFRHLKSFDMFQLDKWWRDWNVQSIIFHKTCWEGQSLLAQTILNEPNPKFVIYSII